MRRSLSMGEPGSSSSPRRIDWRQQTSAGLDGFRGVQTKVLAKAAGDQLYTERDVFRDTGRHCNAWQSHNGGSKDGRHRIEYVAVSSAAVANARSTDTCPRSFSSRAPVTGACTS